MQQEWIPIQALNPAPEPGAAGRAGTPGGDPAGSWGRVGCSDNSREIEEEKPGQRTPGGLPE